MGVEKSLSTEGRSLTDLIRECQGAAGDVHLLIL